MSRFVKYPKPGANATIRRFEPAYWTVDFPLAMMATIVTPSANSLRVKALFRTNRDLMGVIWEVEDRDDHGSYAYPRRKDCTGCVLEFDWVSTGIRSMDKLQSVTLTVETFSSGTHFVRIWNYKTSGTPDNCHIRIVMDQSTLSGFYSDTFVPWNDVKRMFISLLPSTAGRGDCSLAATATDGASTITLNVGDSGPITPGATVLILGSSFDVPAYTVTSTTSGPVQTVTITPPIQTAGGFPIAAGAEVFVNTATDEQIGESAAQVDISNISVTGPNSTLPILTTPQPAHNLRMTDGFDNAYPFTPKRLVDQMVKLGYSGDYVLYMGISKFHSQSWNASESRYVVDPAKPKLNAPTVEWLTDFFARLHAAGFKIIVSVSFEVLAAFMPTAWKQRDYVGNEAQTGWVPPSSLIAPTNTDGRAYLRDVFLDTFYLLPAARWTARASAVDNAWYSVCWSPELGLFAAVALSGAGDRVMTSPYGADAAVHAQIGEPWWWDGSYSTNAPHIYDAITEAAYVTATGLPVPSPRHTSILETPTTAQRHYLEWCRDQLGAVTAWLIAQIKISYPSVTTYLLIFTPQILRGETPMLRTLNFPEADWKFPAFDVLQIEDYDRVVLGDYAFTDLTWELALNVLDYPIKQVHYFAGFNLLPETTWIWFNTDIAIYRAFQRNPLEVFVWSREQVMRDGWLFDRQSWKLYPNTTRLAQCWKIERTDGVTQAFTSFDQPLTVDGTTYEPANSFSASQFASDSDMSVADVELLGALDADDITAEALLAGVYDHAEVELFVVDWSDLTIPKTIVRRGWIGNISQSGITFRAELRGLGQRIQQPIIESYSPECRVDLFSPRCGASRAAFAVTATVTSLTDGTLGVASDNRVFFSNTLNQEDDWFKYGELIWTTGANAGHTTEIRSFKKGRIELWEPMGLNVAVGDTFTIHAGCDKSLATCRAKFNNVVNFRGEPHVPGNDAMLAYPDSQ